MIKNRVILHIDLDAFYCSVEELLNPDLKGKPFAVGGSPEGRGVVASCSYPARVFGIRSAMPMARAIRLCPQLIIVKSHFRDYSKYSREVMDILHRITDLVEQVSIDEAFLEVSDINETGDLIAQNLQTSIRNDVKLPCSIGVASNKLLAKIANDFGKSATTHYSAPNAITIVPAGDEAEFLAPLPVEALSGVGPKTAERLAQKEIYTIGDIAKSPLIELSRMFGKIGPFIHKRANGIDDSPIVTCHEMKSASHETTFAEDVSDKRTLLGTLQRLSNNVGKRLEKANQTGKTVKVKIRWPDFTTLTRQLTLEQPTNERQVIFNSAAKLFEETWKEGNAVRLIGVGVSNLQKPARQLSFWDMIIDEERKRDHKLDKALDILQKRFGEEIILRGSDL